MDEDTIPDQEVNQEVIEESAQRNSQGDSADVNETVSADTTPLTQELISQNVSLVGRTANGLSHAFLRLELHEKEVTNTSGLAQYPHLRYVDLSDNQLVSIKEVGDLSHLLSLNLQNNVISKIPSNFDKKKYLQQLNLAKNRLQEFPISLPHLLFLNINGIFFSN
jgi:Leucine-rich repeat (LRR) protein